MAGRPARCLVATSSEGTVVRWNHGAQELLGYTPPEVLGRHIADLLHPGATAASAGPCGRRRRRAGA